MGKIFINWELNINNYNLSYDFFNNKIGIDVQECYPSKTGFNIVDKNKENYFFVKILEKDLSKYLIIFDILENFEKSNIISKMYSFDGKKYFFDEANQDYYIIFKLGKGIFKKWIDIDLNHICNVIKNFYKQSSGILNQLYNFKNFMEIMTIGSEVKFIDNKLISIRNIDKIISLRGINFEMDKFFIENKGYLEEKLLESREFFIGKDYRDYCEDYNNIKFIHGNISNKSFIFNDSKIFFINFYNSSIDLFIKDIAIFIKNGILHFDNSDLSLFVRNLLVDFNCNDKFHLDAIKHYLNVYQNIFYCLDNKYFRKEFGNKVTDKDKINEINFIEQKKIDFIENYLFI